MSQKTLQEAISYAYNYVAKLELRGAISRKQQKDCVKILQKAINTINGNKCQCKGTRMMALHRGHHAVCFICAKYKY